MPRRPQTARPDLAALTPPERRIVLEEQALLERVLGALRARRATARPQDVPELLTRLKEEPVYAEAFRLARPDG